MSTQASKSSDVVTESEFEQAVKSKDWHIVQESPDVVGKCIMICATGESVDDKIVEMAIDGMNSMFEVWIATRDKPVFIVCGQGLYSAMLIVCIAAESVINEATSRHIHNTRVQRTSKDASIKNINRCYGQTVADIIRDRSSIQSKHVVKSESSSVVSQRKLVPIISVIPRKDIDSVIDDSVELQISDIRSTGVTIDRAWISGIRGNFVLLVEYIDRRDYHQLKEFLSIKNPHWRRFFTKYTGQILPLTDRETVKFIATFASY